MLNFRFLSLFTLCVVMPFTGLVAQIDSTLTDEEEDYSIYDDLEFVDESAKRFASVKVNGKSPDKLITVGYDFQGSSDLEASGFGDIAASSRQINATHGLRIGANIPVISKNSIILQVGFDYWNSHFDYEQSGSELEHPLHNTLNINGLNTIELSTTAYKPLNDKSFLLARMSAGMSGDYALEDFQPLNYNRYSVAVLWGKKPTDSKQWAIGVSRTYKAGELNYLPVVLYNWTSANRKWGIETLFPARGDVRYNFNPRSMLFFGFDLEGTSYRIGNSGELDEPFNDLEIRRGELRFRLKYERQLTGFIWISAKAGYRYNYSFNVDRAPEGEDFFRGFFGDQSYVMENELTNPLFFNLSINLVSP
ncbi:MAG: DUF6268 family outer membrane beta-barrel protein [Flavobacteriales bacterium]